jgi:hypothetical protein
VGSALENKDGDPEGVPRALAGCYAELDRLLNKINNKDGRTSRKKALAWTVRQGEFRKTLNNLHRFQEQLSAAFLVDQAYAPCSTSDAEES